MSRRAAFIPLAWILITCQCLTALLGSHGILLCREADGPAHVEWAWANCCPGDAADQVSTTDQTPSVCSSNTCVDEPIGSHLSLHTSHAINVLHIRPIICRVQPRSFGAADVGLQYLNVSSATSWLTTCGPPDPSQRALRSTILRL